GDRVELRARDPTRNTAGPGSAGGRREDRRRTGDGEALVEGGPVRRPDFVGSTATRGRAGRGRRLLPAALPAADQARAVRGGRVELRVLARARRAGWWALRAGDERPKRADHCGSRRDPVVEAVDAVVAS